MRTLKLTHEEIQLLCQALGIAERKFSNIHTQIMQETVNVRAHHGQSNEQTIQARYYHDLSCKIADLNLKISGGEADV